MKRALPYLFFFILGIVNLSAQPGTSVSFSAPCLGQNPFVFTYDGANSPDGSGRNVFFYSNTSLEIRYNTGASRWEMRARGGNFDVYYVNSFTSSPNPPDNITSAWDDFGFCNNTGAPTVTGTGTQTSIGGDPCDGLGGDSDGDGVCNANDICPGFDDNLDNDQDGIPNGCDANPNIPDGILVDASCLDPDPILFTLSGTDGTGRNVYSTPFANGLEVRYNSALGRWEVKASSGNQDVYLYNNFPSYPNPPGSVGTWEGTSVLNCNTAPTPTINGSDTQNTLGCTIDLISVTKTNATCLDNGSITVSSPSGAKGTPTYFIGGTLSSSNATGVFNNLPAGFYYAGVYDGAFPANSGGLAAACWDTVQRTLSLIPDNQPPTASNPSTVNVSCLGDIPAPNPAVVTDEADNCGTPTVTHSGDVNNGGTGAKDDPYIVTREYQVTDGTGNVIFVTQEIRAEDTEGPVVDCKDFSADLDINGEWEITLAFVLANAFNSRTDNCGLSNSVNVDGPVIYTCDHLGANTLTIYSLDVNGNETPCEITLTINDPLSVCCQQPMITCPSDLTLECSSSTDPAATGMATATDGCGVVTISFSDTYIPGCGSSGMILRTWTATDENGDSDECVQTITLVDGNPPLAPAPPADLNVQCADDIPAPVDLTATDNCDGAITVSPSAVITPGNCANDFVMVRTWAFSDACGNISSVSQTITVSDDTAPVTPVPPSDLNVQCADDIPPPVSLTATDNCDGVITVSPSAVITPGNCANDFVMVRTWAFSDACGNTSSVSQTITVSDDTAPVAPSAPANLDLPCGALVPAMVDLTAIDYCDGPVTISPSVVVTSGMSANDFQEIRTWTFSDQCGNTSSISQVITVKDDVPPSIICPSIQPLEAENTCQIPLPDLKVLSIIDDNCTAVADLVVTQDPPAGTLVGPGVTAVTITVMDENGNDNACTVDIMVVSGTGTITSLTCPGDLYRLAECETGQAEVTLPVPSFPKICVPTTFQFRYRTVNATNTPTGPYTGFLPLISNTRLFSAGRYEIEWQVSDEFGTLNCNYYLQIDPATPEVPVIIGPVDLCQNLNNIPYSVAAQGGATEYQWQYSGNGVTIKQNGTSEILLDFAADATGGELTVNVIDPCGIADVSSSIDIEVGNLATCAFINCLLSDLFVSDNTLLLPGMPRVFKVANQIASNATINSPETVIFKSGSSIELNAGFRVNQGAIFVAEIEGCTITFSSASGH